MSPIWPWRLSRPDTKAVQLPTKTADAPTLPSAGDAAALLRQVIAAEAKTGGLRATLSDAEAAAEAARSSFDRLTESAAEAVERRRALSARMSEADADLAGLQTVRDSLLRLQRASVSQPTSDTRDEEVGGIPVDSDYVVFIVDTSGSMQLIWPRVVAEVENIINIHPKIKGFQILSDNGEPILASYRGRWIPDTPQRRRSVVKLFRTWSSTSNSSPVEGLEVALKSYVNPNNKVSIYIFGDDYTGSSMDPVIDALVRLNTNRVTGDRLARVHGVGFISRTTTGRYATLMREVARRNNGTFIALPR